MDSECAESLWGGWFGHSVYEGWLGQDADGETNGFVPENRWLEDEVSFLGPGPFAGALAVFFEGG